MGRPPKDTEAVNVRLERPMLVALDAAIAREPEPKPSRPEMIRKLIAEGLR